MSKSDLVLKLYVDLNVMLRVRKAITFTLYVTNCWHASCKGSHSFYVLCEWFDAMLASLFFLSPEMNAK